MNIVFVGNIIDPVQIHRYPFASVAGNKMQYGIVKELSKITQVDVISSEPHAPFTLTNGELFRVAGGEKTFNNLHVINLGYLNLPLIKQIMSYFGIRRVLNKILKDDNSLVLTYNTFSYRIKAIQSVTKKKHIPYVTIVADVPLPGDKSFFRKFEERRQIQLISESNGTIALTKHILNDFVPNGEGLVIECGIDTITGNTEKEYLCEGKKEINKGHVNVVFSGTLNRVSGIELFVESARILKKSNPDICFHVYGDGDRREYVENSSKELKNIFYHGVVPNDQMMNIQKNADILVCPRIPDSFVTKYTFPSKIIEYLISGTPVICNKLQGIPEEYDSLVNYTFGPTAQSLANRILEIISDYEDFANKALESQKYVAMNKTWTIQAKKIYKYLEKLADV